MLSVFPHNSLLERLEDAFKSGKRGNERTTYHVNPRHVCAGTSGIIARLFDANLDAVEGPFVDICENASRDRMGTRDRESAWKCIRPWQNPPSFTDEYERTEALLEGRTSRIEGLENLHKI